MDKRWQKIKKSGSFYRQRQKTLAKMLTLNSTCVETNFDDQQTSEAEQVSRKKAKMSELLGENHHLDDNAVDNNWIVELEDEENNEQHVTFTPKLSEESLMNQKFRQSLTLWANNFNIRQRALKELIGICNNRLPNILPKDPRTLVKTPAVVKIINVGEGSYWHQGLEYCLKACSTSIQSFKSISININIDGVPIYKSSKDEFWPILFNIHEIRNQKRPMVIGIYYGKGKPSDLMAFLSPFVEEANNILKNGIIFDNGHKVEVKIRCFICDSPARAFVKGVANFNSQHGCLKCTTVGEYSYISHTNVFPRTECMKRTDEGFRAKMYGSHHKCLTPLEDLPINMIEDFPVADSLHLIHLGIVKRCLMGWKDGTFRSFRMKWCAQEILDISKNLISCKLPSEIHRAVRGLDCLAHWKALEYRTFLHYIGIVVLKKYLPYDVYEHFLVLFCATTICSSSYYNHMLELADELLKHYVEKWREIYGEEYMTSNVHNLAHLVDDVRKFGILPTFSSYPFESKLYQIKSMLRHARSPLSQVARRLSELSYVEEEISQINCNKSAFPVLKKENDGEDTYFNQRTSSTKFFYKVELDHFTLSNDDKNKWFLTKKNQIGYVKNIILQNDCIYVFGNSFKKIENYFETPINSSYLNIYYTSNGEENHGQIYTLKDIKCKLVSVTVDAHTMVFIPLLHTLVEGEKRKNLLEA